MFRCGDEKIAGCRGQLLFFSEMSLLMVSLTIV